MRKVISSLVIGGMYLSGQSFCMTPADGEGSKKAFQKTFVDSKTRTQGVQDQRAHSRKSRRAKRVSRIAKRNKRIGGAALIAGGAAAAAYYAAPQAKNLVKTLGTKLGLNEKPVSVVADPSFWARSLNTVTAHPWISTATVAGVVGIPIVTVAVKALINKRNPGVVIVKPSLVKRLAKGTVSGAAKVAGSVYSGASKVKGLFSRNRNETIQKLRGDCNTLQRKNDILQIKNNQLEQEKEDLQKSYDNLKNSDLNASLDEANKKVHNLQDQVNQLNDEKQELNEQLTNLETKNQELEDQITANEEKIKQLQDENQEIQNLQDQVKQFEAEKKKLEERIAANGEEIKQLEDENQKLKQGLQDQMKPIEGANVSTNSNGTNALPE